jgi:branched-chain amino acid transport system ATP-binding protein
MNGRVEANGIVLSVENLAVRFGGLMALSNLNFVVREGEVTSLIGPNGAGKTTAFNVITGFLPASGGKVSYRGQLLNGLRPHEVAELGVVRTFQKTSVFGGNSVFENILIGLHRHGTSKPWEILLDLARVRDEERELREKVVEILDFVGLPARAGELASALAYGEQRLLEVAVALAADPTLLLLDEPVSGMNPVETASFMKMVDKIRGRGITILLVEHDMRMVMGVSDRVVVLNQGEIIAEGTPEEIQRNPEVIRAYLGHGVKSA